MTPNAISDPIIILAWISDQFFIDFRPFLDKFADFFKLILGCILASSLLIDFW